MSLYILMVLVVLFVLFTSSQNKKRRRQVAALHDAVEPGVRVLMTSGIYGIVVEVEPDTVVVEISEGVDVRFKKAALLSVVPHLDDADADADTDTDIDPSDIDDAKLHAELDSFRASGDAAKTSLTKGDTPPADGPPAADDVDDTGKKRRRGHEPGAGPVPTT